MVLATTDRARYRHRSRAARWLVAAIVSSAVPLAMAAGPRPTAAPRRKPAASASASAEGSASTNEGASSGASTEAVTTVNGSPAASLPARSPLTPRPEEAVPVGSPSTYASPGYEQLLADMASLRARVAVVGNAVWKSRLVVSLRTRGRSTQLVRANLALDGAPVWRAPKGLAGNEEITAFELGVAPGLHALTLEVERRDERDERLRMVERSTTTVVVPRDQKLWVRARVDDESAGGDGAAAQARTYDLHVHFESRVVP